jgi:4-hydroxybenzoate polyprenyltransferase
MGLYAGGVTLNDVCDAAEDAVERPHRPIPSGLVPRGAASALSVVLLAVGLAAAAMVSPRSGALASGLVVSILAYNCLLKRTLLGPPIMGLCRGLNFGLGLSGPVTAWTTPGPVVAGFLWLYVTAVTWFSRGEALGGGRGRLLAATVTAALAVLASASTAILPSTDRTAVWGMAILLIVVGVVGLRAVRDPTPARVQQAVRTMVLCIPLFDACLGWVIRGPVYGAAILAWLVPSLLAARTLRVT